MTIWHMYIVCWIPKATDTHSKYVILIVFPQQQWLHKRASMSCLHIQCLSFYFSHGCQISHPLHLKSPH